LNRRERLMATLQGKPVDRPAVSFYEIGGFSVDASDPDRFNIYNSPSWKPLLQLAEEHTDLIRMAAPIQKASAINRQSEFFKHDSYMQNDSAFYRNTVKVGGRTLTSLSRRDAEIDTVWTVEHLLKDVDDLKAYLQMPDDVFDTVPDIANLIQQDEMIGNRGIIMVETPDPICVAASLFPMEDYTIIALTEQELFHALLEKLSKNIYKVVEHAAREFPGHLWRVYGPEYACEPYLPPYLFDEYVVRYTGPIVEMIERSGGFARVHSHGRISKILPKLVKMGASAIDPIEPRPQGDVDLAEVRRAYGKDLVLFGNLEITDIENLAPAKFEKVVGRSLKDGTVGAGRGFVLMPSSSPFGRDITPRTMANYETMVRLTTGFAG
jgi:uroporphyrinogen-III decarboxylase